MLNTGTLGDLAFCEMQKMPKWLPQNQPPLLAPGIQITLTDKGVCFFSLAISQNPFLLEFIISGRLCKILEAVLWESL